MYCNFCNWCLYLIVAVCCSTGHVLVARLSTHLHQTNVKYAKCHVNRAGLWIAKLQITLQTDDFSLHIRRINRHQLLL